MNFSVRFFPVLFFTLSWLGAAAQTSPGYGSTRCAVQSLLAQHPALHFDSSKITTPEEHARWKSEVGKQMKLLMNHPEKAAGPVRKLSEVKRDGYTVQRWESMPLEKYPVRYLVLVPEGVDEAHPAKGSVLCIPGFGQTKEMLAGEMHGDYGLAKGGNETPGKGAMAWQYVKKGLVAVAVDNPSCGELSDNGYFDYLSSSRFLLEAGWSYLGLASWQDKVILDAMRELPETKGGKVIISGFSLGTEPMMVLGVTEKGIDGFVYNDFLCTTRERALVLNAPRENGERPFPNSIEHLIPGFLIQFDFPDIAAAFAPVPLIFTEGGLDRDFDMVKESYRVAGNPENFEAHHYAKFEDPSERTTLKELPEGLDSKGFFRIANVDPPNHYFKTEWVLPWIDRLFD